MFWASLFGILEIIVQRLSFARISGRRGHQRWRPRWSARLLEGGVGGKNSSIQPPQKGHQTQHRLHTPEDPYGVGGLDLNASNASKLFHIIGPQCLQCIRTIPYYWTSMPPMPQSYSIFGTSGDGGDGGGGGGFPRTLDIWRSPCPTCPGTKYPVRGIPHFDEAGLCPMSSNLSK